MFEGSLVAGVLKLVLIRKQESSGNNLSEIAKYHGSFYDL